MSRSLLFSTVVCTAACGGGYSRPGTGAAPAPAVPPTPTTEAPRPAALLLAPGTMRYLWHQDVHIQSDFAGMPPTVERRYSLYLTVTISADGDSTGHLTMFTVDSVTVDSGTQLPPQMDLASAKGFRVSGWLTPTGIFVRPVPSDSGTVASLGCMLPRFRSFFPRLPAGGVRMGDTWTDSTVASDTSCAATITSHSSNHRAATAWDDSSGTRALRLETKASYKFAGSGIQGDAVFTISGSGIGSTVHRLASDGRYLGTKSLDSTTLTIELPSRGFSIPQRQRTYTTVTALLR